MAYKDRSEGSRADSHRRMSMNAPIGVKYTPPPETCAKAMHLSSEAELSLDRGKAGPGMIPLGDA